MTLFSVTEDIELKTLSALASVFAKLRYVAGLRRSDGRYHHWGFEREYGEEAAQRALSETHRELFLAVLRMPVRDLLQELVTAARQESMNASEYLAQLSGDKKMLLPENLGGGSAEHFSSVLMALSSLARSCTDANRLVS